MASFTHHLPVKFICIIAYDYFCSELENMLCYSFGLQEDMEAIGVTQTEIKTMLRGTIIAVSYIIYLNCCFEAMNDET